MDAMGASYVTHSRMFSYRRIGTRIAPYAVRYVRKGSFCNALTEVAGVHGR